MKNVFIEINQKFLDNRQSRRCENVKVRLWNTTT